jgi:hypothetical protein
MIQKPDGATVSENWQKATLSGMHLILVYEEAAFY